MPTKWERMVEKVEFIDVYGIKTIFSEDAANLLARQHARMVRRIEKLDRYRQGVHIMLGDPDGEFVRRDDILAALGKQEKGGR